MSLIGIISDIHGNLASLKTGLDILDTYHVTQVMCLGDLVGYGPEPHECLSLVRKTCSKVIQGNHDAAIVDPKEFGRMNSLAREGILYARGQMKGDDSDYLSTLPRIITLTDHNMTIAHGSITSDHFDYILTVEAAAENFLLMANKYLFVGHSHRAAISAFSPIAQEDDYKFTSSQILEEGPRVIQLKDRVKYIINPGSIGQPRDVPLGGLCVMDTDHDLVTFVRYVYDIASTKRKIINAGLPEIAWKRLEIGR